MKRDWRDSVITGSLVGGAIFICFLLYRGQSSIATNISIPNSSASLTPSISSSQDLTEEKAVDLIRQWLQAKRQVFGMPFNRQIAANFTTGALLSDITKPGGSVDWLQKNNAYYQFDSQKVEPENNFVASSSKAEIKVRITENRILFVNGKIDQSQTKMSTDVVKFILRTDNNSWKIEDYK